MKSNNIISMQNGVAKSGEFSYTRTPRTLTAYGQTYDIPVKTVAFADKLDEAMKEISKTATTSDTVQALKKGIALFIGDEETERIFPADKFWEIDTDEILGFWRVLNYELDRGQRELLARYSAAGTVRR